MNGIGAFAHKYSRGFMSLLVTALVLVNGAQSDGNLTHLEILQVAASLAGTIAVVGIPNTITNPALKTIAQTAAVTLSALAAAIAGPDGVTSAVLTNLVIQGLGVWGVYQVSSTAVVRAPKHSAAG
jgi:hypothetical protein